MATEQQTSYNVDIVIAGHTRDWAGQRVTITNRIVSGLSFVLHKFGSPTGTVTFQIRRISDGGLIMEKAWGTADGLQVAGSEQWESVVFDTPTLINEEVSLRVYYPTNVSNFRVELHYQNTDVKASEYLTWDGGNDVNSDAAYRYTYGASTSAPSVTTQAVSDIDKTTSTGNGTVVSLGEPPATQHGVVWATFENPRIDNPSCSFTEDGVPSATGAYTSSMTNLKANTLYHVRAYITNSVGTFYGLEDSFTTLPDVPTVTTYLAQSVVSTTALGSGNIDNNGGSAITQHGVLWRAGADPDIDTYDGITALGATTFKYFESLMTSLTVSTEYHYRAYAVNDDGTGYGDVLKFTTNVAGAPIVKTKATINITPTSATGRGEIVDVGGSPVTEHGHCWKAVTDPPTVPTTSDSKTTLGAGTVDIVFLSELADLTAGTSYILAAYATNTQGTAYGDPVNINELADELKGQIAYQGEHLLYSTKSGKQRRLLGAEF